MSPEQVSVERLGACLLNQAKWFDDHSSNASTIADAIEGECVDERAAAEAFFLQDKPLDLHQSIINDLKRDWHTLALREVLVERTHHDKATKK